MPIRIVIARRVWLAATLLALVVGLVAVPHDALASQPVEALASEELGSCVDDGAPQAALCLFFDDDDLPPGLCAEDGSARVAPPVSLPVAPDKIEAPPPQKCLLLHTLPGVKCPLAVILRADTGRSPQREPGAPVPTPEPVDPAMLPDTSIPPPFGAPAIAIDTPYVGSSAEGVTFELERPPISHA